MKENTLVLKIFQWSTSCPYYNVKLIDIDNRQSIIDK